MNCAKFASWLSPYLDGALEPQERAQLEQHLKSCPHCQRELASLRQVVHSLSTLPQPQTPHLVKGVHEKLLRAPWWKTAAGRFLAPWPQSLPLHTLALATTAVLIIVLVNVPAYFSRTTTEPPLMKLAAVRKEGQESSLRHIERSRDGAQARLYDLEGEGDRLSNEEWKSRAALDVSGLEDESDNRRDNSESSSDLGAFGGGVSGVEKNQKLTSASEPAISKSVRVGGAKVENQVIGTSGALIDVTDPLFLQVQWRVSDVEQATAQVTEWINANGGLAVATNEHHLSIRLPAAAVPQFLRQFTTAPLEWIAPSDSPWILLSLELVPVE